MLVGLEKADDRKIWEFAKAGGYVIVTKDDDFLDMHSVLDSPPKIILLGLGNCTNRQVAEALIGSKAEIEAALSKEDTGFVEVI